MAHKSVALAADKLQLLWQQWAVLPLCLLLCFMYAADTIMVAASLHWYKNNPTSAQLLLLAEVMKLVIALTLATVVDGCCSQESSRTTKPNGSAAAAAERLPLMAEGTAKPGPLSGLQQVLQRPGVASQVLHFSVPAVCYFVSNNLSFYALRLLPAYTYMLLTSLKILTTALLSYTFLGKEIPTHQQVSYVLMLLAVNLGTAKSSSVSHSPYLSYNIPAGLFIMLAVAACSALATVYTEWVMNYSCYRQESINLQNARLYVAGVVLNGGFYVYQTVVKQVSGSSSTGGAWSDIRLLHWGIIISLAFMGLLVSVIIKWHGSGVKVMASATAMFASAWASQVFLGEAAPWLFWLGAVAAAAALLLHSASPAALPWAAASSKAAAADGPTNKVHSRKRGPQLLWLALIATVGFAAVVAYKAPVSLAASPSPSAASASSQAAAAAAAAALDAANNVNIVGPSDKDVAAAVAAATAAASAAVAAHVDSLVSRQKQLAEFFQVAPVRNHSSLVGFPRDTNLRVPAMYLPIDYASTQQVCAPLSCSLSHQCTVNDPRCCMFYLIKMLEFFTKFVESYGLEREWFAVYGIALGAIRHPGGFTPWTNDVDIGASPRLINFLESTAVRDEMWQYGFHFYKSNLWKVCGHGLHPDPAWQKGFKQPVLAKGQQKPVATPQNPRPNFALEPRAPQGLGWMDLWPAAPVGSLPTGSYFKCDPCPDPSKQASHNLWHLLSNTGWVKVTFKRKAAIGGVMVTIPDNTEEHLATLYGPHWRQPNYTYHGIWGPEMWTADRKHPFGGHPEAFTWSKLAKSKLPEAQAAAKAVLAALKAAEVQAG